MLRLQQRPNLHPKCIYCGQEITAENDSDEHVISEGIEGRRTTCGVLQLTGNHKLGHSWDAALEKQLRPLALHFGVKRQDVAEGDHDDGVQGFPLKLWGSLGMARSDIKRGRTANEEMI